MTIFIASNYGIRRGCLGLRNATCSFLFCEKLCLSFTCGADNMAACHLHSAMWKGMQCGEGCNGTICTFRNPLPAIGEVSSRMVPRIGGSQHLKRTAVAPLEGSRRKNSSRVLALKPPVPPPETTEEETKKIGEEKGEKHVKEEKVIKVERKGLLGQVQSFFAWISAWPSIPEKVPLISNTVIEYRKGSKYRNGILHIRAAVVTAFHHRMVL